MVSQTNPAIAQAWGVIQRLSGDAEARRLAEYEGMAHWDYTAKHEEAFKNGEMKGRQEGRQEERLEVARKLLRKKMSFDDIVDATDLPLEGVKQLASGLTD